MEKSAFDQLDKFIPCQRDLDLLAEMVVSPLMSESSKWRSFHNEAPNWLKQLVLKREMPKGKYLQIGIRSIFKAKCFLSSFTPKIFP